MENKSFTLSKEHFHYDEPKFIFQSCLLRWWTEVGQRGAEKLTGQEIMMWSWCVCVWAPEISGKSTSVCWGRNCMQASLSWEQVKGFDTRQMSALISNSYLQHFSRIWYCFDSVLISVAQCRFIHLLASCFWDCLWKHNSIKLRTSADYYILPLCYTLYSTEFSLTHN